MAEAWGFTPRSPLTWIKPRFTLGNYLRNATEHLLLATPSKAARPLSANRLQNLLRHPYYRGAVTFQGVEYPGNHEALVDAETWQQVQDILTSHHTGERQRLHNHHLKTTAVCSHCGGRLLVQNATARGGDLYRSLALTPADRRIVQAYLDEELDHIQASSQKNICALRVRRTQLEDQRRSLLQAHYAGAIPLELLKEEQDRISRQLAGIEHTLKSYETDATLVRSHLDQALDLLEDCHRMYTAAPDHLKKLLNQVFFTHILINPETDEHGRVIVPPDRLTPRPGQEENSSTDNRTTQPAPDITIHDPASHTTAAAFLIPPFDQLASSRLQYAAMTSLQPQTSAPKGGRTDRGADAGASGSTSAGATTHNEAAGEARRGTRAETTAVNRAAANANNTAQGDGSCKRLMVGAEGLEPPTPSV